jgi:hypothetical protein
MGMHRVICNFDCIACGQRLGAQALRLGKDFLNFMDKVHRNNPGRLISFFVTPMQSALRAAAGISTLRKEHLCVWETWTPESLLRDGPKLGTSHMAAAAGFEPDFSLKR